MEQKECAHFPLFGSQLAMVQYQGPGYGDRCIIVQDVYFPAKASTKLYYLATGTHMQITYPGSIQEIGSAGMNCVFLPLITDPLAANLLDD